MMAGNLPVVPSRASLSASGRAAAPSTIRNGGSQRFFGYAQQHGAAGVVPAADGESAADDAAEPCGQQFLAGGRDSCGVLARWKLDAASERRNSA